MTKTATKPRAKAKTTRSPLQLVEPRPVVAFELIGDHAERFIRAARVAGPFASRDDARAVITALHLVSNGKGTLRIEATDSYKLAAVELPQVRSDDKWLPAFDVLVRAPWLLANLPKSKWAMTGQIGFEITDSMITVHDRYEDVSATSKLIGGDYPNVSNLAPEHDIDGLAEVTAFNPAYLNIVLKACQLWGRDHAPARVRSLDPMKPCRFDVVTGDGTLSALLMPVRIAD